MIRISKLLLAGLLLYVNAFSQTAAGQADKEKAPSNWYQLDYKSTGYNGISLEKAYTLIKANNLKSTRIIVAVIDTGIDTLHEDLKPVLWTNPKEIPGNGIDDDNNGYIDDIHGWNFLGNKDGRNVSEDSYEASRVYYGLKEKWDGKQVNVDALSKTERDEFMMFSKAKDKVVNDPKIIDESQLAMIKRIALNLHKADSLLKIAMDKVEYTGNELNAFKPGNSTDSKAKVTLLGLMKADDALDVTNKEYIEDLDSYISGEEKKVEAKTNAPREYRKEIVGDNENDINDINYGNNNVMAVGPFHGTHCSGIIAASVKDNKKGLQGIADNVRIMMLRAVPDGDEHDKDVANAIRYAVNNGAKIISMSFGKEFSPHKQWVDDAFRFAESKGVLLVQAAGNDAEDIDVADNFPSADYIDGKGKATNLITVGASGNMKNGGLTASFSNYGKNSVDIFAPGVNIYAPIPGNNNYGNSNGTSFACPIVAGIAALILEHYPTLSPQQLKYIIEKSAVAPDDKVTVPGTDEVTTMDELCRSGGIVNAYEAVKLAESLKNKQQKTNLPKPKLKKTKMG